MIKGVVQLSFIEGVSLTLILETYSEKCIQSLLDSTIK
jgi:hypothetical protein